MHKSEKFWDGFANNWDRQAKNPSQTHIKAVENTKIYLNVNDIVLDYGCATGTVAIEIAGKVKEVHGIDISSKMIEAAKRKAAERKIENIDFTQSTIFNGRLKRESFDVILALNILHLAEDTRKVMQGISELLRPGGLFISAVPCLGEKKSSGILIFLLGKIMRIPYTRFFKISELEDFITNGDFRIAETKSLSQNPPQYFIVAKKIA